MPIVPLKVFPFYISERSATLIYANSNDFLRTLHQNYSFKLSSFAANQDSKLIDLNITIESIVSIYFQGYISFFLLVAFSWTCSERILGVSIPV